MEHGSETLFQSTHPSGVRPTPTARRPSTMIFQSTHPSGVRLSPATRGKRFTYFNPRTPVGCDDSYGINGWRFPVFQSTHPSGVRRWNTALNASTSSISIHAPQWGATAGTCTRLTPGGFQSTHPSGVRRVRIDVIHMVDISIHAPQWGATVLRRGSTLAISDFNPRTPVGCDFSSYINSFFKQYFNPRTPVGCDRRSVILII